MRKFIFRVLLFFAIMFVVDRLVDISMNYLASHPKGGMTQRRNYITDICKEDVLIFGSSRAHYHYSPQIVTDSLGMTCFNCGENAMGIVHFYAWWKIISQRYHPQLLIYEVTPEMDIRTGSNYEYLWRLRNHYENEDVRAVFEKVEPKEKWKMVSRMYRYNSTFTEIAADIIHPMKEQGSNGFVAVNRTVKPKYAIKRPKYDGKTIIPDTLKMGFFEKMIKEMGPTQLILVASPYLTGINRTAFDPIREMSQKYGVPFLDYSNDSSYLRKTEYFYDSNHLNATGAEIFTRNLVGEIRKIMDSRQAAPHDKQ